MPFTEPVFKCLFQCRMKNNMYVLTHSNYLLNYISLLSPLVPGSFRQDPGEVGMKQQPFLSSI